MSNAPSTHSGNLEVDEENREGCARLDERPVEVNTQAAIRLLRQHFSTGQSDHAAEVSHVLGTISRLNEGQRPVGGGQVLSANDTGAPRRNPLSGCTVADVQTVAQQIADHQASSSVETNVHQNHQGRQPENGLQQDVFDRSAAARRGLNAEQQGAFAQRVDWCEARSLHTNDPYHHPAPEELLLLVHGGPGTGKSYFANTLAQALPAGRISFAATTGVAATAFPEGRTLHNLLALPINMSKMRPLTLQNKAAVEDNLRLTTPSLAAWVVVIDEISMMGPEHLSAIAARLQEVGDASIAFGGFAVVLMGDFYQLTAVGSQPLYASVLNLSFERGQQVSLGAELFRTFRLVEFTQQMRAAECQTQQLLVDSFRQCEHPIKRVHFRHLRQLTSEDVLRDPSWLDAVIVTPGNQVRNAINKDAIQRLGHRLGVPVFRWRLPLTDASARQLPVDLQDQLYDHCTEAWGYFVVSAPAYLDFNLKPTLGLANGTACRLYSVVLDPSCDTDQFRDDYACAQPGQFVDIRVPHTVNVQLVESAARGWPSTVSTVEGVFPPVVPLPGKGKNTFALGPKVFEHGHKKKKIRALSAFTSGFDLSFSVTYHKVQGKTVSKVILCVNKASRELGHLTTQALYVGLTRVRRNDDMRIFPLAAGQSLDHLLRLKIDPRISQWRRHYDSSGMWRSSSHAISTHLATQRLDDQVVVDTPTPMEVEVHIDDINVRSWVRQDDRDAGETPALLGIAIQRSPSASAEIDAPPVDLVGPLDRLQGGLPPLAWGSPLDETFSWLFVPVIRAALHLDGEREYEAEVLAGPEQWFFWTNAYAGDFLRRGITAESLTFQPNGYLGSEHQERLLFTQSTGHDIQGESTVDLQVQNTLFMFGATARGRALQDRFPP